MMKKELKVNAIKNGTVIDHIAAKNLFKVISILKLHKISNQITFGNNLESHKHGNKAIIKISDLLFEKNEIDKIALVAPNAVLNVIKNYEVVEKKKVNIPDEVIGIAKCFNPNCITNNESMQTRFSVLDKQKLALKCHYCEKITDEEHLYVF